MLLMLLTDDGLLLFALIIYCLLVLHFYFNFLIQLPLDHISIYITHLLYLLFHNLLTYHLLIIVR